MSSLRAGEVFANRFEIDRLAEEVRVRQEALEHRHDYRSIIGRGPAMVSCRKTRR